ncbi:hypothetical protein ACHAWF_005366 [Thalassiosira exigua]
MGSKRNRLVRIFVNAHRPQALEKEN